jgi:hypothetical protein
MGIEPTLRLAKLLAQLGDRFSMGSKTVQNGLTGAKKPQ